MALPTTPSAPSGKPANERDAAQQDVFLREVDEALREQQVVDIAKRYGKLIGGGIVLGVGGLPPRRAAGGCDRCLLLLASNLRRLRRLVVADRTAASFDFYGRIRAP